MPLNSTITFPQKRRAWDILDQENSDSDYEEEIERSVVRKMAKIEPEEREESKKPEEEVCKN